MPSSSGIKPCWSRSIQSGAAYRPLNPTDDPAGFVPLTSHPGVRRQPLDIRPPQGVFPDPQDPPTGLLQGPRHQRIATFVGCQLFLPERSIVLGLCAVFGTTVPETTIHEHRRARFEEDKVRTDGELMVFS